MTIKEQLRELAAWFAKQPESWLQVRAVIPRDALVEIERLETEISDGASRLVSANAHIDKLIAEREECRVKLDAYTDRMIAAGLLS